LCRAKVGVLGLDTYLFVKIPRLGDSEVTFSTHPLSTGFAPMITVLLLVLVLYKTAITHGYMKLMEFQY